MSIVDILDFDDTIRVDIRYATKRNFLGRRVYQKKLALFRPHVARALVRVHKELAEYDKGLLIFDGYRPWYVTKIFWDETPDEEKIYLADPKHGSVHNRGCAVDCALFSLKTNRPLKMPSLFDVPTTKINKNSELLKMVMEKHGFLSEPTEWWHFHHKNWKRFPVMNLPL
jgi:D-alanyl-D-alanine dipeptidase